MPKRKAARGGKRGGRTTKSKVESNVSDDGDVSFVDLTNETEEQDVQSSQTQTGGDEVCCNVIGEELRSDNQEETLVCETQHPSNEDDESVSVVTEGRSFGTESNLTKQSSTGTSVQVSNTNSSQSVLPQSMSVDEKKDPTIDSNPNTSHQNTAFQGEQKKLERLDLEGLSQTKENHHGLTETVLQTIGPCAANEEKIIPSVSQGSVKMAEHGDDGNTISVKSQTEKNVAGEGLECSSLQKNDDLQFDNYTAYENLENIKLLEGKGANLKSCESVWVHDDLHEDKNIAGQNLGNVSFQDLQREKDVADEGLEDISLQENSQEDKNVADENLESVSLQDDEEEKVVDEGPKNASLQNNLQEHRNVADENLENVSPEEDLQQAKNVADEGLEDVSLQENLQADEDIADENFENVSLQEDLQEEKNVADEGLENVSLQDDLHLQEEDIVEDEGLENISLQDDLEEDRAVADEGLENVSLAEDSQEEKDLADEGLETVSIQDDLQVENIADEGLENVSLQDNLQEENDIADEGLENVSLQDDLQDEKSLADEGLENISLQEDLQEEKNVADEGLENVSLAEDLQREKSMADEGLENISLHEDAVEAELGKVNVNEEQVEVQYIDEDAEEEEQQLLDIMTDVAMTKSPVKVSGHSKNSAQGNNYSNTNNKFEEISEGSIDHTEQEDVLNDTFSDVEIIEENFPRADKKEEVQLKKSSVRGAETLEEVFFATENDDYKVTAEDKDNDDISDASFDDQKDMSLEEISDDDVDVSKRRKKSTEAFKSNTDMKEEKPPESVSNVEKDSENITVLTPPSGAEKKEDEKEKTCTDSKKRSPSADTEIAEGNKSKKPRLSAEKEEEKENGAAFYTNICGIKKVASGNTEKKSVSYQSAVKEPQRKQSGSSSKGAQRSSHCQTDTCVMRGKIVQCNIRPIKADSEPATENSLLWSRKPTSKFLEQFGHKIPPSLPRPVIATITSLLSSQENYYHLALGPVTFGDMDLTDLRNNFLKLSDKSSIDFDENHHGVYKALFKKQENVASFVRHLKSLHLGNRYLTLNLVYMTKGSETSQIQLNGTINLMFEQDIQSGKQHLAQGDGKLRAKLLLSNMPYKVSKDFVHLLFPEALSVSSGSQFDGERSIVLGFTNTKIAKETTMRYDLVVINGKQVNISALDYVVEEPETLNLQGSEPVVILDSESEIQDGSQTTTCDNLVECFDEMDQEEENTEKEENTDTSEVKKIGEVTDGKRSSGDCQEGSIISIADKTSQQSKADCSASEIDNKTVENIAVTGVTEAVSKETPTLKLSDSEQGDAPVCGLDLSEKVRDPAGLPKQSTKEPIFIPDDLEVSGDAKDVQLDVAVAPYTTEFMEPAKVVVEESSEVCKGTEESNGVNKGAEESSDINKSVEESSDVSKGAEESLSSKKDVDESFGVKKQADESTGVNIQEEESPGVNKQAEESSGEKKDAEDSSGVNKGAKGKDIDSQVDEISDSSASNSILQAEEVIEVIEVSCGEETHGDEPVVSGDSEVLRQDDVGKGDKGVTSVTEDAPVIRKSLEDISDEDIKAKENEAKDEDTSAVEPVASKSREDLSEEETKANESGCGDKDSSVIEPGTSENLEDISDEEIQQQHKGGRGKVDDVVVLREDSSTNVLANIDLTVDTDSDTDAAKDHDNLVNKPEASSVTVKDEKNLEKKSPEEVDEKRVITDAGFEIDMEVIDVDEDGGDKTVEKVLYPSKSHRRSRERSNTPSRSRRRSREQSFSRDKSQRYHPRGLSPPIRTQGGWTEYSNYRGERTRGAPSFREDNTRRRDNFQHSHRRSPVSPSRDARYYRDSHPPHPVVGPPPIDRGFYPPDRPLYPQKPPYPQPAHHQISTYSRFPVSSHPPAQSQGPYGGSSSKDRVYQMPQREGGRTVYETTSAQRDSQSARHWEFQMPPTQQERRRTPSSPPRKKYRSRSRSLSDLSVDSYQGRLPAKRASRGNTRRDVAPKKISRSPVSVSSNSRSLSPVSRSPTPDRLSRKRDEIVKSVKQFLHAAKGLQNMQESRERSVSQHSSHQKISKQSALPIAQHPSAATSSRRSPANTGSRRSPFHTSRRSPGPVSSRRSPVPASFRRSPVPASSRRSPVPASSRRSPVPVSSRRSPVASSSRRSPIPAKSRRSPVHTSARQSPGQMSSNTQRRVLAQGTYHRSRSRRSQSPVTHTNRSSYRHRSPSPVSSDSNHGSPPPAASSSRRRDYRYDQSAHYKYSQTTTSQSRRDSSNLSRSKEDTRQSSLGQHNPGESQYSHRQNQQREYPPPQETHNRHMTSQQQYAPPPIAATPPNPSPYGYPPAAPTPYGAQYPTYNYHQQMAPAYTYQSQPYGGAQAQPQYPMQSHYPPTGATPQVQQAYQQALGFLQTAIGGSGIQHTAQPQTSYPGHSQVQGQAAPVPNPSAKTKSWSMGSSSSMVFQRILGNEGKRK